MKSYYIMQNVGSSKYVVNYHDGVKSHRDGSQFFDIAIFKNKRKMEKFIADLVSVGYRNRCAGTCKCIK